MKYLLIFITSIGFSQTKPMLLGEPFPYSSGLALSVASADSTRRYVYSLQQENNQLKVKNLDLAFRSKILAMDNDTKTESYQAANSQIEQLKDILNRQKKNEKIKFWIGAVGAMVLGYGIGRL